MFLKKIIKTKMEKSMNAKSKDVLQKVRKVLMAAIATTSVFSCSSTHDLEIKFDKTELNTQKKTTDVKPVVKSKDDKQVLKSLQSTYSASTKHVERLMTMVNHRTKKLNSESYKVRHFAKVLEKAYDVPHDKSMKFASWIHSATKKKNVPAELLAGLIQTESNYQLKARSHKGAIGPAQLRPVFWKEQCSGDLKNPKNNILCGATVLRHYYDNNCNQDWNCATRLYNVGPTNIKKTDMAKSSIRYLKKVTNQKELFASTSQLWQMADIWGGKLD